MLSRRPQTFANVLAEIAADAVDFVNVCIGFFDCLIERFAEADDVGDAMAGCCPFAVGIAHRFVPPNVAIEWAVNSIGKCGART